MSLLPCAAVILAAALVPQARARDGPSATEEIMRGLSEMRGHQYREGVLAETLRLGRVRSFLLRKLRQEYPRDRLEVERKAMVHLGFLEKDDDLEGLFVAILSDQAAGFYDPDTRRLYLVKGKPFPGMALIHELAHALQDQTFGIAKILGGARANDDALLAAQAMLEGEASLLTERFVEKHGERDPEAGPEDEGRRSAPRDGRTRRIPRLLQRAFIFPYVEGTAWARAIAARGGNPLMDEFFLRPPDSTEQILHPARTAPVRDLPSIIGPGVIERLSSGISAAGYNLVHSNVMGEFMLREMLGIGDASSAATAADGWDGDRYAIYERSGGGTAMVWISVWDTPADAVEFRDRVVVWLKSRHPAGAAFGIGISGEPERVVRISEGFEPSLNDWIVTTLDRVLPTRVTLQ